MTMMMMEIDPESGPGWWGNVAVRKAMRIMMIGWIEKYGNFCVNDVEYEFVDSKFGFWLMKSSDIFCLSGR